jgi:parvulin-like peptidyl-prolyl isomerase
MWKMRTCGNFMLGILVAAATSGCWWQKSPTDTDSMVVASVEGTKITRLELDIEAQKNLGSAARTFTSPQILKKMLDSMITRRAMALTIEKELSATDRENLDKMLRIYREELLVREYLKRKTEPKEVTEEMARDYYQKNLEKFGAKVIKQFEWISGSLASSEPLRTRQLQALSQLKNEKNWSALPEKFKKEGLGLKWIKTEANDGVLDDELAALLRNTQVDQTSNVFINKQKVHLLRVNSQRQTAPIDFAKVQDEIYRMLELHQLKSVIETSAAKLLPKMKISYASEFQNIATQ